MKKRILTIRNRVIGEGAPKVCLPLVAATKQEIFTTLQRLVAMKPDLVEWRVDAMREVWQLHPCIELLPEVRTLLGDIPLIFTCRRQYEGGMSGAVDMSDSRRLELYTMAAKTGCVDIIDGELSCGEAFLETLRLTTQEHRVRLIISSHNFHHTPDEESIVQTLLNAEKSGADIAKIAVTAKCYRDMLTLLCALDEAKRDTVRVPMIAISMGAYGAPSRIIGGLFGSDITFASGEGASAPGQYPVVDLRRAIPLFYEYDSE